MIFDKKGKIGVVAKFLQDPVSGTLQYFFQPWSIKS